MTKKRVTFTWDEKVKKKLKVASNLTGQDQSQIVEEAVEKYLRELEGSSGVDLDSLSETLSEKARKLSNAMDRTKKGQHSLLPGDEEK